QSSQQKSRRLKFDFHTLNEHAIRNSQRLAQDADAAAEDENGASGAWRGKQPESAKRDQTGAQASDSDDWAGEYMAQDAAHHTQAEGSHEPTLDAASRAASDPKPAISEEDEMLMALKQAIKPKKP
ncbi:MAG: hypothetical protein V3T62_08075, partial [Alphaproteobacteria bacterium]